MHVMNCKSNRRKVTFVLVWILYEAAITSSFQLRYAKISRKIPPFPTVGRSTYRSTINMSSASIESTPFPDDESSSSSSTRKQLSIDTPNENVLKKSVDKDITSNDGVPTYRKLMIFICTTILIWLSEPLLSLVDTTVIGQSSARNAVVQLAALGPSTMLIDSGIYTFYFLSIATTNIMAPALAKKDYKKLQTTASHVMGVATVLGSLITAIVFAFGKPLLEWTSGTSSTPELIRLALAYSQIRSLAAPFAILGCVTQSICLATLDTFTPALAVAAACAINVIGDIWLVSKCNMGIEGAAIATATASVASSMILLRECRRKMVKWRQKTTQTEQETTTTASLISPDEGSDTNGTNLPAANGDIAKTSSLDGSKNFNGGTTSGSDKVNGDDNSIPKASTEKEIIPFMSLPDRNSLTQLVKLAGPIFFVMVGKIICYSSMTLRATDFGVLALACHNVMMRIFFFYGTFGDSMSQAVQSFLPQVLFKGSDSSSNQLKLTQEEGTSNTGNKDNKRGLRILLLRLGIISACLGATTSQAGVWILKYCGSYFTRDTNMMAMMAKNTGYLGFSLLLHPFIMLFEGAMIATGDLTYLCFNYLATIFLLLSQLKFATSTFGGVWRALFVFQVLRVTQCSVRFFNKTIRGKGKNA